MFTLKLPENISSHSLYSLLPVLLISCVFLINLPPLCSPVSFVGWRVVSVCVGGGVGGLPLPHLSFFHQSETDAGVFSADKAANFINYEPMWSSLCGAMRRYEGPTRRHLVHCCIQGNGRKEGREEKWLNEE